VAKLAELPDSLIDRARTILSELESEATKPSLNERPAPPVEEVSQLSLFESNDAVREQLLKLDLLAMNPIEAMQALYELQQTAKKG
jgi:DNA mismatch repair protein MutS